MPNDAKTQKSVSSYTEGISIITPCYNGEKHIPKLLESLRNQELSYALFEVIIVINGRLDGTPQIVEEFKEKNPQMNIKILYSRIANASNARNIAIAEAKRKYSTLIDADDYISPNYLKELYKNASEDRIVFASFLDVEKTTGKTSNSYITEELLSNSGPLKDPYDKIPNAIVINACKLIPSSILKKIKFNIDLHSGEDVEFFSRLITLYDLEFYVLKNKQAIYYRVTSPHSVSRKDLGFKFNVLERLNVIKELNDLLFIADSPSKEKYIKGNINGQCVFIHRYVSEYPEKIESVQKVIRKLKLNYFPYNALNRDLAKKLVISYCFPPYMDTSGNVMAKRIKEGGEIVDVVHGKMAKEIDQKLNLIAEEYIDQDVLIDAPYSYYEWELIKKFCNEGMKKIDQIISRKGEYEEIYSRVMFPSSHFLAFEYKIKYPHVKWVAEFSDSMLYDTKDTLRYRPINDTEFLDKLNDLLLDLSYPKCEDDNLFFLCEYLPYVFADEIVFTNINQKEHMINKFPDKNLRNIIDKKTRIERHPIPPEEFYYLIKSDYPLDNDQVNLAYFGVFYNTRNLDDVLIALYSLDDHYKEKCKIHIFTNDAEDYQELIKCKPIGDRVEVNPYVDFFEFLNLTTKFDCLIVNDAHTKECKEVNPYLPSKLSDYLGSGTDIWAICEEGSAMSQYDVKYKSTLDDIENTKVILKRVIEDCS